MRNGIDITKEDVRVCDELIVNTNLSNKSSVNATYELWFDVEKYFGIKLDADSWINMYTDWYENGVVIPSVFVDTDNGDYQIDYEFTPDEEEFFANLMKNYCEEKYGMTLNELIKEGE